MGNQPIAFGMAFMVISVWACTDNRRAGVRDDREPALHHGQRESDIGQRCDSSDAASSQLAVSRSAFPHSADRRQPPAIQ